MDKAFDEQWVIGKVHPFRDRVFENKYLFFKENRFFKAIKPRECVSNDIVFARDKINVRVELFNIIETANYEVRCSIVCGDVEMVGMDVYHGTEKHCVELC